MSLPQDPAERHRSVAATFNDRVNGVVHWDAPTPVEGWTARDVVAHLVLWFPGFLSGGTDLALPPGPDPAADPVGAWIHHSGAVQAVLDDPATADRAFDHPMAGSWPLDQAIDRFYTSDVFMHTWDLARATDQDDTLDAQTCAEMFAGMSPMEEVIRGSGHYGVRVPVPADADPQTQLLGFIGRDPAWRPPGEARILG